MSTHTPSEHYHTLLRHSKSDTGLKNKRTEKTQNLGLRVGKTPNIFIKASLFQIPPGRFGSFKSQAGLTYCSFLALGYFFLPIR